MAPSVAKERAAVAARASSGANARPPRESIGNAVENVITSLRCLDSLSH